MKNQKNLLVLGIDLYNEPNGEWEFVGYTTNIAGNKVENFKKHLTKTNECPFDLCETEIISGHTTFFFSGLANTKRNLVNVLSIIEKEVCGNVLTKKEILKKYASDIEFFWHINVTTADSTYVINHKDVYSKLFDDYIVGDTGINVNIDSTDDGSEICISISVNGISSLKPEIENEFILDKHLMYTQTIDLLKTVCLIANNHGELIGTEDTLTDDQQMFFAITRREELANCDYLYGLTIEPGVPLSIVEEGEEMIVKSIDGIYVLGYVPSILCNALKKAYKSFIEYAIVLSNDNDSIVVAIQFDENASTDISAETSEDNFLSDDDVKQYTPHINILDTTNEMIKPIKNSNIHLSVVGIQYHETIEKMSIGLALIIKREWDNIYDDEAYGYYTLNGELVGYVPKREKSFVRLFMANGELRAYICEISNQIIGVVIELTKDMIDDAAIEKLEFFYIAHKHKNGGSYSETQTSCTIKELRDILND